MPGDAVILYRQFSMFDEKCMLMMQLLVKSSVDTTILRIYASKNVH